VSRIHCRGAWCSAAAPSAVAFHRVFLLTVPFMVVSLVLGLVMREKPLSREMAEIAEDKAEAPRVLTSVVRR
jgi:hypothetical protein